MRVCIRLLRSPRLQRTHRPGKSLRATGTWKITDIPWFLFHHLALEEPKRLQRLLLGIGRDLLVEGQMTEERVDFRPTHLREPFAVVGDAPLANPGRKEGRSLLLHAGGFQHLEVPAGPAGSGVRGQQPDSLQVLTVDYHGARVEIALLRDAVLPLLVAVHFVRHGFCLPFVGSPDQFSTSYFRI